MKKIWISMLIAVFVIAMLPMAAYAAPIAPVSHRGGFCFFDCKPPYVPPVSPPAVRTAHKPDQDINCGMRWDDHKPAGFFTFAAKHCRWVEVGNPDPKLRKGPGEKWGRNGFTN
jgi:hypothetical protein